MNIDEATEILTPTGTGKLLYGILNWVNMNKPETVKNFVLMRVFLYMAPDSDAESRAALELYYKQISLSVVPRYNGLPRSSRGINNINSNFFQD